jgi:hypothetical protein
VVKQSLTAEWVDEDSWDSWGEAPLVPSSDDSHCLVPIPLQKPAVVKQSLTAEWVDEDPRGTGDSEESRRPLADISFSWLFLFTTQSCSSPRLQGVELSREGNCHFFFDESQFRKPVFMCLFILATSRKANACSRCAGVMSSGEM